MKNLAIFIASLITINTQAQYLNAQCSFTAEKGTCYVRNELNYPIKCNLYARGVLPNGTYVNGNVWGTVLPGQVAHITVRAHNPYFMPLIDVQGWAECNF